MQVLLAGSVDLEVDMELPVLEEAGLWGEPAQRRQGKSRDRRWGRPGPLPASPRPRALTMRFQMEPSRLRSSGVRRTYWLVTMVLPWKSHSGMAAEPAPATGRESAAQPGPPRGVGPGPALRSP